MFDLGNSKLRTLMITSILSDLLGTMEAGVKVMTVDLECLLCDC